MRPAVVLDTNVILDCWHFHDPGAKALREHLEAGALRVLSCEAINDELRDVLSREAFRAGGAALMQHWLALSELEQAAAPAPWRCRDPDDQIFLDLAVSARAQALITKDKALLVLKQKAALSQPKGPPSLLICKPEHYCAREQLID